MNVRDMPSNILMAMPIDGGPPGRGRGQLARRISQVPVAMAVGVLWLVLVVVCVAAVPGFGTMNNATTILAASSVVMIASLGQLLALISGGFDLSVGGAIALGAVVFGRMTTDGHSAILSTFVVLGMGAALGFVHMIFISRFNVNALITTLGTMSIVSGLAFILANGSTVSVPVESGGLGEVAFADVPWHVLLAITLVVAMHLVLARTVFGRLIYMVGGNLEAARLAGVRVAAVGAGVYVLSSMLAALAGVVLASQILAATGGIGSDVTLQTLAAVVLGGAALTGGRGSVPGAVVGVLLLATLANCLSILRVQSFYQQIATGAVLLFAVVLGKLQENARRSA